MHPVHTPVADNLFFSRVKWNISRSYLSATHRDVLEDEFDGGIVGEDMCDVWRDALATTGGSEVGRQSDVGRAMEEKVFDRLRHIAFVAESVGVDVDFVEVLVEAAMASS